MSGSTGGRTCSECKQNGQHSASCSQSNESVQKRRDERKK